MTTADELALFADRRDPRPTTLRVARARVRGPWWQVAVSALLWVVVAVGGLAYAASLAVPLWYQLHGQRLLVVTSGSMAPRFVAGDVVVLRAISDASELKVDQVVTFRPVGSDSLVTHRIVELHQLPALEQDTATGRMVPVLDGKGDPILQPYIVTRGDANSVPDPNATPVSRVRGVVIGWHHDWGTVLAWAGSAQGRATMLVPPLVALGLLELFAVLLDRRRDPPRLSAAGGARSGPPAPGRGCGWPWSSHSAPVRSSRRRSAGPARSTRTPRRSPSRWSTRHPSRPRRQPRPRPRPPSRRRARRRPHPRPRTRRPPQVCGPRAWHRSTRRPSRRPRRRRPPRPPTSRVRRRRRRGPAGGTTRAADARSRGRLLDGVSTSDAALNGHAKSLDTFARPAKF
jgi:signal peptidase